MSRTDRTPPPPCWPRSVTAPFRWEPPRPSTPASRCSPPSIPTRPRPAPPSRLMRRRRARTPRRPSACPPSAPTPHPSAWSVSAACRPMMSVPCTRRSPSTQPMRARSSSAGRTSPFPPDAARSPRS